MSLLGVGCVKWHIPIPYRIPWKRTFDIAQLAKFANGPVSCPPVSLLMTNEQQLLLITCSEASSVSVLIEYVFQQKVITVYKRRPVIPIARELKQQVKTFCPRRYGRNARAVPAVAPPLGSRVPSKLELYVTCSRIYGKDARALSAEVRNSRKVSITGMLHWAVNGG